MIDALAEHLRAAWSDWGGKRPDDLELVTTFTGTPQSRQVVVRVAERGARRPAVVVKGAPRLSGGQSLMVEHAALVDLEAAVPDMSHTFPEALGLFELENWQFLATVAVEGRPTMLSAEEQLPKSKREEWMRYTSGVSEWSQILAAETETDEARAVTEFAGTFERFAPLLERRHQPAFDRLAETIADMRGTWRPAWQHRNPVPENVLLHGGKVRLLDWERSHAESPPWRDLAYLPLAACMFILERSPELDVAHALGRLDGQVWVGRMMHDVLEAHWPGPLSPGWAILLVAMDEAITASGSRQGRPQPWIEAATALATNRDIHIQLPWMCPI